MGNLPGINRISFAYNWVDFGLLVCNIYRLVANEVLTAALGTKKVIQELVFGKRIHSEW